MAREHNVQVRLNDREQQYLEELSNQLGVSESEAVRTVLYDSRFLYSEFVKFEDILISSEKLIPEEESNTTGAESVERVLE